MQGIQTNSNEADIKLYSYPELFRVPDNNPYGLKVYAFLKLVKLPFEHVHILDTTKAPRGQLPYLTYNEEIISDSNNIITFLTNKFNLDIDNNLDLKNKNLDLLVRRMLDEHLYWVMSYSRWADDDNWPLFKQAFLTDSSKINAEILNKAREYNLNRYYFQGIGRYDKEDIYEAGIKDLSLVRDYLGEKSFFFGDTPHTIDACIYGFLANIYFFDIKTPLRDYILANKNLSNYCERIKNVIC